MTTGFNMIKSSIKTDKIGGKEKSGTVLKLQVALFPVEFWPRLGASIAAK